MPQPLEPGGFIRLEIADSTLFCEVKYCHRASKMYTAGLLVERVLIGASQLAGLIEQALEGVSVARGT